MSDLTNGKRAIPAKNEPKCKLCGHGERERIDQLLLARSLGKSDAAGNRINGDYVLAALRGLGVENPTLDNLKTHFGKHVDVVDADVANQIDAATEETFRELIEAAPAHLTATNVAEWQIKLWMAKELARLRSGEGPSVTTDQAQSAQKILVQAKSDESTRQLLGALGGAITASVKRLPLTSPEPVLELEAAEDAEVVES